MIKNTRKKYTRRQYTRKKYTRKKHTRKKYTRRQNISRKSRRVKTKQRKHTKRRYMRKHLKGGAGSCTAWHDGKIGGPRIYNVAEMDLQDVLAKQNMLKLPVNRENFMRLNSIDENELIQYAKELEKQRNALEPDKRFYQRHGLPKLGCCRAQGTRADNWLWNNS